MTNTSDYKAKLLKQVEGASDQYDSGARSMLNLAASDEQIADLIKRLADPSTPVAEQISALTNLHVIRNFSKVLPTHSAELTNALRGLIKSPDSEVRRQALSYLSLSGDEVAQDHLRAELESDRPEAEKSVPTYQAISMLSARGKAVDKGLLLSIAENPPDDESLVQAVRHLPADADTIAVLTKILQDNSKPIAARALVPDIVSTVDPESFASLAKRMLEEQGAESDIAPYLARGVASVGSNKGNKEIEEARTVIRSMATAGSAQFREAADLLDSSDDGALSE